MIIFVGLLFIYLFFNIGFWLFGGEGLPSTQGDPFSGRHAEKRPSSQLRLAGNPTSWQGQRLDTHGGEERPTSSGRQGISQRAKL